MCTCSSMWHTKSLFFICRFNYILPNPNSSLPCLTWIGEFIDCLAFKRYSCCYHILIFSASLLLFPGAHNDAKTAYNNNYYLIFCNVHVRIADNCMIIPEACVEAMAMCDCLGVIGSSWPYVACQLRCQYSNEILVLTFHQHFTWITQHWWYKHCKLLWPPCDKYQYEQQVFVWSSFVHSLQVDCYEIWRHVFCLNVL